MLSLRHARLGAEYVLPLKWATDAGADELTDYLALLSRWVDVTVVDGSPSALFQRHRERWQMLVRHMAPEPWPGRNGKVAGVMTGVRHARHDRVVVADDDVRYDLPALSRVIRLLDDADVVRPQNYFDPLPWHARWDTARSLINRAFGSDYPGTLGVRRDMLAPRGYDGDVLFENLELIRTVRAAGGREARADDLFVARRPPTTAHFLGQRVRQAYDGFTQPGRLVVELSVLPAVVAALVASRSGTVRTLVAAGAGGVAVAVAEAGRRRNGGREVFPATSALWAPLWIMERAVCAWIAVGRRLTGGIGYAGERIVRAGTSEPVIGRRLRSRRRVNAARRAGVRQRFGVGRRAEAARRLPARWWAPADRRVGAMRIGKTGARRELADAIRPRAA